MTGDELDRAIDFLLKNQARHDAQIKELNEQLAQTNKVMAANAETQSQLIQVVTSTFERQDEINNSLRAAVKETSDAVRAAVAEMRASVARLSAKDDELNGKLDRLTDRVDKLAASVSELRLSVREVSASVSELRVTASEQSVSIRELRASVGELHTTVGELAGTQSRTDERLDRLAAIVERHVGDGHGGAG